MGIIMAVAEVLLTHMDRNHVGSMKPSISLGTVHTGPLQSGFVSISPVQSHSVSISPVPLSVLVQSHSVSISPVPLSV